MVVIVSLVVFDIALSLLKNKSRWLSKLIDGEPMIIVEHG